ncbi:MAG: alkaline phosphatase family protein [Flavobacteriaceae bacterium]|nr:alkaline phosphatase family protein [Flavobacteriaceae bacterium]
MKHLPLSLLLLVLLNSCQQEKSLLIKNNDTFFHSDFTLAFGSGNNQSLANTLWPEITKNKPDVWVWGGDIVYSDTEDMDVMRNSYALQKNKKNYKEFCENTPVIGTWDDHDYGINDGGIEYKKKNQVQQILLDFLDVDSQDPRRFRPGVYHAKTYQTGIYSVQVILLDTRYFRTKLLKDPSGKKRYLPTTDTTGSMLGDAQWKWLEETLSSSKASFNIIISSIQFLSSEHGFESWGTMPHEVKKMENLIVKSMAKNTIILSGDRHISEFSKKEIGTAHFPLIDFTSSGLTHSYEAFKGEENPYRIHPVISVKSFGIVKFNFKQNSVKFEIRGKNNQLLSSYKQVYTP